jgi:hypothetical protein
MQNERGECNRNIGQCPVFRLLKIPIEKRMDGWLLPQSHYSRAIAGISIDVASIGKTAPFTYT